MNRCDRMNPDEVCPLLEEAWQMILALDQECQRMHMKKAGVYLAFIRHQNLWETYLEWERTHHDA